MYTLKQLFNSDLNQTICALMDGDTYGGSLTAAGAATVARLFQPGHTVKIRVTRVGDTKGETWSPRLKRFQAWTHGRGEVWQEKDEPDKDEDAGKASSGFDGSSAPKCKFPLGLLLGARADHAKPWPPTITALPGGAPPSRVPGLTLWLTVPSRG